ncbi:MAG TPA: hypothetical protein VEN79_17845, partial [Terriglobia bacterium]|nr:hypothetical protein [Terriglobia bacterium]
AGIITKNTGIPSEPKEGFPQWAGASNVLPVVTCNPNLPASQRTTAAWFNKSCFSQPGVNQFGSNSDINIIRDDGAANLDTTLSKYFKITEQQRLQIRAEFFNAFNHPLFGAPGLTRGTSTFGLVTSAGAPRAIEFAVKYEF